MIDVKRFSGVLNTDDNESDVLPAQHIQSRNIKFKGGSNVLTAYNIKGNFLVNNSNLPAGTNENNGSFYDSVNHRILWFNWNSNGNHGLYQLTIQTGQITQIFRCGLNSTTDILRLSRNYPVHSMAIVYRSEGEGDLLYFTNGNAAGTNRPRFFNLGTVTALSPLTEDMINAAKNAPLSPAVTAYRDDATTNVNNLQKKLFRFIYRWVYKNGEKSTWSPISKTPLPPSGYDPNTQNDPTKNNNIRIPVIGGGSDYQKIEVAGQISLGVTWSDFFLIDTLDRTDYNIAPSGTYNYDFYNNGSYPSIDVEDTDLYYSWLPDYANTLELLNGNVLIYGGITEGYDKIARSAINVVVTAALGTPNVPTISFAYSGANVFTMQIGSVLTVGATYNVFFDYNSTSPGDASPKNINYVTPFGPSVAAIAAGIAALLTGQNIAVDNLGSGMLRVRVSPVGVGSTITNVSVSVNVAGAEVAAASWKWSAPYRFGLIYFDDRGKTNGVISFVSDSALDTTDFAITTPAFNVNTNVPQVPIISSSINHTPPTWATSYQWVRANLLPTRFLYWVTNDYQSDTDYLYICIQNLVYTGTKNTGFVPSYEFTEGDRVRVIAAYTGGNYIPYNVQLDMEVLGVVQILMSSPATAGTFLKVAKPTTLPSAPYQAAMFIELYTPSSRTVDRPQFFYEWGEKYDIYTISGTRYHRGQVSDQTASQPATFQWFDGDVYYKGRRFYTAVSGTTTATEFTMDANYNDYFSSAVNSNGRGWLIDENAKTQYNGVLLRWGGEYQPGTNINRLNRFRPNDFDEADRSRGDIRRFKVRGKIIRVFQDRGVGQYGIYARFIRNNDGVPELVTTNEIITTNNIQYYQGVFGLSGYPTNLCSSPIADYFNDVVTGREIRLSGDGNTDLGVLYKGQFYFPSLVTPYNKDLLRVNGAIAKVMKFFDTSENQSHTVLQAGSANETVTTDQHYSFNETRNGFCCDGYDFIPEWALSADDILYTWKNGECYKHDNRVSYCNFYGTQFNASITFVFNSNLIEKKSWQSITEIASDIWDAPVIYTNSLSYGTQRQQTSLVPAEFVKLENNPAASIKRDANSRGGKISGDQIKGNYCVIKFQKQNAVNEVTLSELSLSFVDSPKTVR